MTRWARSVRERSCRSQSQRSLACPSVPSRSRRSLSLRPQQHLTLSPTPQLNIFYCLCVRPPSFSLSPLLNTRTDPRGLDQGEFLLVLQGALAVLPRRPSDGAYALRNDGEAKRVYKLNAVGGPGREDGGVVMRTGKDQFEFQREPPLPCSFWRGRGC